MGGSGHYHNPNAMDMDHLTLSLVEYACHMCKNYCFICHKEGCSTRNHPGYNHGHPAGSWHANLKPSQIVHSRIVSTTPHLTPTPSHQDDLLDLCHQNSRMWSGTLYLEICLQYILGWTRKSPCWWNPPTAKEWNKFTRVLTVEAMPHVFLPDHHVSF